ncbi:MAG: hypothetical protein R2752_00865 [Vicinamibacterales bacterium]
MLLMTAFAALALVIATADVGASTVSQRTRQKSAMRVALGATRRGRRLLPASGRRRGRRFDTRVFLLRVPAGQDGLDRDDRTATGWATPADLLARRTQGTIALEASAHWGLDALSRVGSAAAALALAERTSLEPMSSLPE